MLVLSIGRHSELGSVGRVEAEKVLVLYDGQVRVLAASHLQLSLLLACVDTQRVVEVDDG